MAIVITDNGQYKTAGFWTTAGAVIVGSAAQSAVANSHKCITQPILKKMQETSQSCDNKTLRAAINDAFTNSKLSQNSVELLDVKQLKNNNAGELAANKKLHEAISNSLPKFLRETTYGKLVVKVLENTFKAGNNAAYLFKTKKIAINIDKLGTSAFHEMGHAINHNQSKIWKIAQGMRLPSQITGIVFGLTALLKRKKLEGEQPVNTFDKVTTFVKDNVGKLVLASFVPIVSEELMATYRGNKMAKKLLPSEMFAKVKKTNRLGAVTYLSAALLTALASYSASKVRDKIAEPTLVKNVS